MEINSAGKQLLFGAYINQTFRSSLILTVCQENFVVMANMIKLLAKDTIKFDNDDLRGAWLVAIDNIVGNSDEEPVVVTTISNGEYDQYTIKEGQYEYFEQVMEKTKLVLSGFTLLDCKYPERF